MKKFAALILATISALTVMVSPALAVPPPEKIEDTIQNPIQVVADELGIPVEEVKTFTDTDAIDVTKAYNLGVVSGTGNGEFRPLGTLTRAEFIQMLYRAFGNDSHDDHVYQWSDNGRWVTENDWWTSAAHWYEDVAIYPFYDEVDEVLISKLWENFYGFDAGKYGLPDLMARQRESMNDSIEYEEIVMLSFMFLAAQNGSDITLGLESLARNWAESRMAGAGDNWRFVTSRTNAYITRAEGVSLLFRLFDL